MRLKNTVFANYGSKNLLWLFGRCLCQDCPFVLCCRSCVQQSNTVRLLCRRDFLYGRRSQNHSLHSFVAVLPVLCSTIFPGRIGVFLRQQQFVPLDLWTSSRVTHRILSSSANTHDRFNKPSGITNSMVNVGKTYVMWSFAQYFVFCNTDTYNNKTGMISIQRLSCQKFLFNTSNHVVSKF